MGVTIVGMLILFFNGVIRRSNEDGCFYTVKQFPMNSNS